MTDEEARTVQKAAAEQEKKLLELLIEVETVLEWTSELQRGQLFSDETIMRIKQRTNDLEDRVERNKKVTEK